MNDLIVNTITGSGLPLAGNDIDTDRIIPARFLKCVTFDGIGEHAFEDDIVALKEKGITHPFADATYSNAKILVSNQNFGCGSSREHAPQAIKRWGINTIIAESYSEIFYGNCVSLGVPCFIASHEVCMEIIEYISANPQAELSVSVENKSITLGDKELALTIADGPRQQFLEGTWNAQSLLVSKLDSVKELAASLPYVNNFS